MSAMLASAPVPERWVVTGAGRSGTMLASVVLRRAGVRCGHEAVFRFRPPSPRSVRWDGFDADSSWIAVPYLRHQELFGRTVLLVRHPLEVVRSWLELDLLGRETARRPPGMVDRCAAMWLHWNSAALPYADAVVRHRDLAGDAAVLLEQFGVAASMDVAGVGRVNGMERDKRRVSAPEWGDLRPGLARGVREMAERLGCGGEPAWTR